jgi:two-component system, OmpR family, response regulator
MNKVLIVDDEEFILEMYSTKLRMAGYEVFTASSATEGIALAERERPDVIFTDVLMEDEDGFWFLNKIKKNKDKKLAHTPVIILTNLDDPPSREKCSRL